MNDLSKWDWQFTLQEHKGSSKALTPYENILLGYAIISRSFSEEETVTINVLPPANDHVHHISVDFSNNRDVRCLCSTMMSHLNQVYVPERYPASTRFGSVWHASLIASSEKYPVEGEVLGRRGGHPMVITCVRSNYNELVCRGLTVDENLNHEDFDLLIERLRRVMEQLTSPNVNDIDSIDVVCRSDEENLRHWNTDIPGAMKECMHNLITQQARLHAEREAVCAYDGSWSYAALEQRSSALAINLKKNGLGSGSKVPLMFEKSKWHIVALIAVS